MSVLTAKCVFMNYDANKNKCASQQKLSCFVISGISAVLKIIQIETFPWLKHLLYTATCQQVE